MKRNLTSLSDFIDEEVGAKGTKKRDKFEIDYRRFITKAFKDLKGKRRYFAKRN